MKAIHLYHPIALFEWRDFATFGIVILTGLTMANSPVAEPTVNDPGLAQLSPAQFLIMRIAPDAPLAAPKNGWTIQTAGGANTEFHERGVRVLLPGRGSGEGVHIRSDALDGARLRDIGSLKYRTWHAATASGRGLALVLKLDLGEIVTFQPAEQSLPLMLNDEREWETASGRWHSARHGDFLFFRDVVARYPDAVIHDAYVTAGFGEEPWGYFDGYIEEIAATVSGEPTRFRL